MNPKNLGLLQVILAIASVFFMINGRVDFSVYTLALLFIIMGAHHMHEEPAKQTTARKRTRAVIRAKSARKSTRKSTKKKRR